MALRRRTRFQTELPPPLANAQTEFEMSIGAMRAKQGRADQLTSLLPQRDKLLGEINRFVNGHFNANNIWHVLSLHLAVTQFVHTRFRPSLLAMVHSFFEGSMQKQVIAGTWWKSRDVLRKYLATFGSFREQRLDLTIEGYASSTADTIFWKIGQFLLAVLDVIFIENLLKGSKSKYNIYTLKQRDPRLFADELDWKDALYDHVSPESHFFMDSICCMWFRGVYAYADFVERLPDGLYSNKGFVPLRWVQDAAGAKSFIGTQADLSIGRRLVILLAVADRVRNMENADVSLIERLASWLDSDLFSSNKLLVSTTALAYTVAVHAVYRTVPREGDDTLQQWVVDCLTTTGVLFGPEEAADFIDRFSDRDLFCDSIRAWTYAGRFGLKELEQESREDPPFHWGPKVYPVYAADIPNPTLKQAKAAKQKPRKPDSKHVKDDVLSEQKQADSDSKPRKKQVAGQAPAEEKREPSADRVQESKEPLRIMVPKNRDPAKPAQKPQSEAIIGQSDKPHKKRGSPKQRQQKPQPTTPRRAKSPSKRTSKLVPKQMLFTSPSSPRTEQKPGRVVKESPIQRPLSPPSFTASPIPSPGDRLFAPSTPPTRRRTTPGQTRRTLGDVPVTESPVHSPRTRALDPGTPPTVIRTTPIEPRKTLSDRLKTPPLSGPRVADGTRSPSLSPPLVIPTDDDSDWSESYSESEDEEAHDTQLSKSGTGRVFKAFATEEVRLPLPPVSLPTPDYDAYLWKLSVDEQIRQPVLHKKAEPALKHYDLRTPDIDVDWQWMQAEKKYRQRSSSPATPLEQVYQQVASNK